MQDHKDPSELIISHDAVLSVSRSKQQVAILTARLSRRMLWLFVDFCRIKISVRTHDAQRQMRFWLACSCNIVSTSGDLKGRCSMSSKRTTVCCWRMKRPSAFLSRSQGRATTGGGSDKKKHIDSQQHVQSDSGAEANPSEAQ